MDLLAVAVAAVTASSTTEFGIGNLFPDEKTANTTQQSEYNRFDTVTGEFLNSCCG